MLDYEINQLVDSCDHVTDSLTVLREHKEKTKRLRMIANLLEIGETLLNEEINRLRTETGS